MAVGTLLLGLAPTYAQAGVLGPVILVVARALQGFSVGGEFANSSTFMIEYAPRGRRERYGRWHIFSQMSGVLAGAVAAGVLTLLLDADALCTGAGVPLVLLVLAGVGVLAIERAPRGRVGVGGDPRAARPTRRASHPSGVVEARRARRGAGGLGALVVLLKTLAH
jgi:MFS family permease